MGIALACCRYRSQPQASRLLPGRVHVPIQPAAIKKPRQALLPPRAASRSSRARSLGSDYSPRNQSQNETTTCRGYLSQADTPQDRIGGDKDGGPFPFERMALSFFDLEVTLRSYHLP